MATLQQLQAEVLKLRRDKEEKERKLRIFRENQREIVQRGRERLKLQKELKDLKNPKSQAFKKNVKQGLIRGGRVGFKFLQRVAEAVEESEKPTRRKPSRKRTKRKNKR